MKKIIGLILVCGGGFLSIAQPVNDNCANAIELCPNEIVNGTTQGATIEQCLATNFNGCADDNATCTNPGGTVWYKFTTNSNGGSVSVDFTNLAFDPDPTLGQLVQAMIVLSSNPCEGANYTVVSNCQNNIPNGVTTFSLVPTASLAPNTTYYIQVNGSAAGPGVTGPASATFDIEVSGPGVDLAPLSIVNFNASNTTICQGDEENVSFEITGDCPGTPQLEWYYNGNMIYAGSDFSTSILTETGELYVYANCGPEACPQEDYSDSIHFDVTPILADAGPDIFVELGETVTIEGSGIGDPVWTPSTGLSTTLIYTPLVTPDVTTTYFLTVTSGNCIATDEVVVAIKQPIKAPSGFTPNDDGNNDVWQIEHIGQYENNEVIIFDRAGQIVFKTVGYNNSTNSWDGTYKDRPVPPSTYFYVIDLRNGDEESVFRGPVTIIR